MKLPIFVLSLIAIGCGTQEYNPSTGNVPSDEDRISELETKILALSGTQSQINDLIMSDWSSCVTSGPDTLTTFQQNICRIAQAATVEAKAQLKGELATLIAANQEKLVNVQNALDSSSGDITSLQSQITSVSNSLSTLTTQVNTNTTNISTLTASVASINSQISAVINGAMLEITIGVENLSAGPLYESVLRNPGRSRITAYIDSVDANKTISNNGVSTTNGSPTVIITSNSHGYNVGNVVKLNGLNSTNGLSSAVINDQYVITGVTANTFTITVPVNATSNGAGGGNAGYVARVNGRGLGRAWQTSDGEVSLSTTFSIRPYSFLVTGAATTFGASPGGSSPFTWVNNSTAVGAGWVCYSITNRSASAATIKSGGSDIRCY